jgi:hypothetical protein
MELARKFIQKVLGLSEDDVDIQLFVRNHYASISPVDYIFRDQYEYVCQASSSRPSIGAPSAKETSLGSLWKDTLHMSVKP